MNNISYDHQINNQDYTKNQNPNNNNNITSNDSDHHEDVHHEDVHHDGMQSAIDHIRRQKITNKFDIVKTLMERAERLTSNGEEKKRLVNEAYVNMVNDDAQRLPQLYSTVSLDTINTIVEAFIYVTKTAISVNKSTNCWSAFTSLFKKKK